MLLKEKKDSLRDRKHTESICWRKPQPRTDALWTVRVLGVSQISQGIWGHHEGGCLTA
jgi:hypothetical protein